MKGDAMAETADAIAWDAQADADREDRERFKIEDDSQATWAMRKAAATRARLTEIQSIADAEIERIQQWAEHESRVPMRDLDYFEGILIEYGRRQRAEGRKTVSTPYGAIKSRSGQTRFTFSDKAQFIEWAKVNRPDWLVVKEEPSLSALRDSSLTVAADPDSGEVIPGLDVEPPIVNFTVEVSK
jgi:hypothetical protein